MYRRITPNDGLKTQIEIERSEAQTQIFLEQNDAEIQVKEEQKDIST